jgi:hypothetical protein
MSGSVTAQSLITQALKANGVGALGQTPNSADLADGLTWANMILAQWQRRRWLVWHLVDIACPATGAVNYTVGPGQSFSVMRPDKIEYAYARLMTTSLPSGFAIGLSSIGGVNGVGGSAIGSTAPGVLNIDYPLYVIDSREEYAQIGLKSLQTFPGAVFYDSAYPIGSLYFWPIPNAQFELHILVKEKLQSFATLSDAFAMPPEYQEALVWSLAARMRPAYGLPPDPTITSAMQASINVLRMANVQIPTLEMPEGLPINPRGGAWWLGIGGSAGCGGAGGGISDRFVSDSSSLDGGGLLG